jgi:DNA-binding NarL/FixJ family response regulator
VKSSPRWKTLRKTSDAVTRWRIGAEKGRATLAPASAATISLGPARIGAADAMINSVISMGVIDERTFTRECIIRCLRTLDDRLRIEGFPTCDECLQTAENQDLVLYHLREDPSRWDKNSQKLISFRKLLSIVSVIILSDTENQNLLSEIFESGARGFIPTDTTLEQIREIIRLVCVGGVFVPLSSLSLRKTERSAPTELVSSNEFTRNELAVLDRLKVGKANKIIAYELGLSESTVKVHIGRIMKKLNVTNRTQIVCRAYTLAADRPLSLAAGPSPAALPDHYPGRWLDGQGPR